VLKLAIKCNMLKIKCNTLCFLLRERHGWKREIHVKKDKFDSKTLKKQVDQLAHIINNNTAFMNILDDLPLPEFHHVSFAEWEEFKTKGRDWNDRRIDFVHKKFFSIE